MKIKSIVKNGEALSAFFEKEKKHLLHFYPGLSIQRLKQDFKLMAFIHGIDNGTNADEIFDRPYLSYKTNPLTIFFEKLSLGIPLEYITGYRYFYKSLFRVTPDVLIPRSETEILVEKSVQWMKKHVNNELRVLDLGTGSGAIALSILMDTEKKLDLVASDISEKALKVARENYSSLKYLFPVHHQMTFIQSDRFHNIKGQFDLICTNPPYIKRLADREGVHHQVQNSEPHLALFLDDDLYELWFRDLFTACFEHLAPSGMVIMEGHENHLEHLSELAKTVGFSQVELIKDYTDRLRFLKILK